MAFFEELGKKISNAGQGVAQQTKNFADVAKLNSAISEKERQIAQLYTQIGSQFYDRHKDDTGSEFPEQIAAITALINEIAQCRENIKAIKGLIKCPGCGADIPAGTLFCNTCGTRIVQEQQPAPQPVQAAPTGATRFCTSCGSPVPEGYAFCTNCGNKLDN